MGQQSLKGHRQVNLLSFKGNAECARRLEGYEAGILYQTAIPQQLVYFGLAELVSENRHYANHTVNHAQSGPCEREECLNRSLPNERFRSMLLLLEARP